jgi:hypothetical protein
LGFDLGTKSAQNNRSPACRPVPYNVIMSGDHLLLRPTAIGGDTAPDDYQVIWNGMPIGRILKQPGVPLGRPNWFWGVVFPGRPQPSGHRGLCTDLEECKPGFGPAY